MTPSSATELEPTAYGLFGKGRRRLRLASVAGLVVVLTCGVSRSDAAPGSSAERQTVLRRAWGVGQPATVNLGMWTRHVDRPGVDNDALFGGTVRGVFVGTFENSWHDRSYVLAIERRVFRVESGALSFDGGYRMGVIHGYDERMIGVAGKTPVVPFAEPIANVVWRNRVGIQAGFCVKVVTWGAIVRF